MLNLSKMTLQSRKGLSNFSRISIKVAFVQHILEVQLPCQKLIVLVKDWTFEAAAEAIEKGEWSTETNLPSSQQVMDFPGGYSRFVSSTTVEKHQILKVEEKMVDKIYPIREEFLWRPSSILCKRFDLIDPFMGKPLPPPRARSKFDGLIFMPDSGPSVKSAEANPSKRDVAPASQSEPQESEKQQSKDDPDAETNSTSVQRPVDLYKPVKRRISCLKISNGLDSNIQTSSSLHWPQQILALYSFFVA